jgi:hypothetical protein
MLPPLPPPPKDDRNPNLGAALASVVGIVPPARVEQVWVFPPRQIGAKETGLAVLVAVPLDDESRRAIYTLRYEAITEKGKTARADRLEEQGTVPPDRVDRIIEGVVRRLEGTDPAPPDIRDTARDPRAWRALVEELGHLVVDPHNQE